MRRSLVWLLFLLCLSSVSLFGAASGEFPVEDGSAWVLGSTPLASQEPPAAREQALEIELQEIRDQHSKSVYFRRWKRRLDQAVVIGLALPAAAVSSLVAITIKLVDGGPVLFIQKRIGQHGKPFWIVKFRTLDDSGPTALGWWLRRTRLDEIPQLWNVWKGEMSLVGPRPLYWHDAARFEKELDGFSIRQEVLPGMAGLAQVEGATYARETRCEAVLLDKQYVCNLSLLNDAKIVIRGVGALILGKCPP